MNCKEMEIERDDYEEARAAEADAIRRGDYSFEGVGEPCG